MTPQQRYFTFLQISVMIAAFWFGIVVHACIFCPAYRIASIVCFALIVVFLVSFLCLERVGL